jgi:hypothetical protein
MFRKAWRTCSWSLWLDISKTVKYFCNWKSILI